MIASADLGAQHSPLSLWIGAGRSVRDSGSITLKSSDVSLGLQLDVPVVPFALRAEGMVSGADIVDGPKSWFLNAVVPLRLPGVQPYLIGGYGVYSRGTPFEVEGVNYGVGARIGLGRLGLFGEVRKHDKLDRTTGTIGITL
jgi:hypothetical protein